MKKNVKFYPVKTIKEALKIAFEPLIDKNPSKLWFYYDCIETFWSYVK